MFDVWHAEFLAHLKDASMFADEAIRKEAKAKEREARELELERILQIIYDRCTARTIFQKSWVLSIGYDMHYSEDEFHTKKVLRRLNAELEKFEFHTAFAILAHNDGSNPFRRHAANLTRSNAPIVLPGSKMHGGDSAEKRTAALQAPAPVTPVALRTGVTDHGSRIPAGRMPEAAPPVPRYVPPHRRGPPTKPHSASRCSTPPATPTKQDFPGPTLCGCHYHADAAHAQHCPGQHMEEEDLDEFDCLTLASNEASWGDDPSDNAWSSVDDEEENPHARASGRCRPSFASIYIILDWSNFRLQARRESAAAQQHKHLGHDGHTSEGNVMKVCAICWDEQPMRCLNPCGHLICGECIRDARCPICRTCVETSTPLFSST